mmetsp:Transcript_15878/g.34644  ORF Transcript_15878/g.34644 Transcript_15878/m.34644 type:complete len:392 (+) Transcript_15878:99-1274(+)
MQNQGSPQPAAEGGYPSSLFSAPPPDDLKCSICMDVLRDPVQVCSEHHTYCRGCINRWKGGGRTTCPECRAPFSKDEPARVLKNIIEKLEVRCSHACGDPSNTGGSGATDSSSSSSCDGDVPADTAADDGHQHKKRRQEEAVTSSAPAAFCEWTGQVREYEAHMAACPFVEVSCPFADAGCAFRAARGDMDAHRAHLLMLMTTVAVVEAESVSVRAECAAVRAEIESMREKIASLEEDSSSLQRYMSILHTTGEAEVGVEWVSSFTFPATDQYGEFTYTGQIRAGRCHGFGRASWATVRLATRRLKTYDGQWKEGNWCGRGVFRHSNGDSFDGQWVEDKKHGQGVFRCANGDREEGRWVGEKRQGKFIFTKAGTRYERMYEDNIMTSETLA